MRTNSAAFKISYCGIISALAVLSLFAAIIPSLVYIMPAIAGMMIWSVSDIINGKWALMSYAASCLLALFLTPEIESKTFFIMLFGYYPLMRDFLAVKFKLFTRIVIKLVVFNIAAVISYTSVVYIFGIDNALEGLEFFGKYAVYVFWGMGNVAFFLYDYALRYADFAFNTWLKPVINKRIK